MFCTQNNVFVVDSPGGGELSLFACPGWGMDRQVRTKLQIPGGMVTGRIEPCITLASFRFGVLK